MYLQCLEQRVAVEQPCWMTSVSAPGSKSGAASRADVRLRARTQATNLKRRRLAKLCLSSSASHRNSRQPRGLRHGRVSATEMLSAVSCTSSLAATRPRCRLAAARPTERAAAVAAPPPLRRRRRRESIAARAAVATEGLTLAGFEKLVADSQTPTVLVDFYTTWSVRSGPVMGLWAAAARVACPNGRAPGVGHCTPALLRPPTLAHAQVRPMPGARQEHEGALALTFFRLLAMCCSPACCASPEDARAHARRRRRGPPCCPPPPPPPPPPFCRPSCRPGGPRCSW